MKKAEPILKLKERTRDIKEFIKLKESILYQIEVSKDERLKEAQELIKSLQRRQQPRMVFEYVIWPKPMSETWKMMFLKHNRGSKILFRENFQRSTLVFGVMIRKSMIPMDQYNSLKRDKQKIEQNLNDQFLQQIFLSTSDKKKWKIHSKDCSGPLVAHLRTMGWSSDATNPLHKVPFYDPADDPEKFFYLKDEGMRDFLFLKFCKTTNVC